LTFDF
jgi:hypothetical protein